jgi:hypothetical protein
MKPWYWPQSASSCQWRRQANQPHHELEHLTALQKAAAFFGVRQPSTALSHAVELRVTQSAGFPESVGKPYRAAILWRVIVCDDEAHEPIEVI